MRAHVSYYFLPSVSRYIRTASVTSALTSVSTNGRRPARRPSSSVRWTSARWWLRSPAGSSSTLKWTRYVSGLCVFVLSFITLHRQWYYRNWVDVCLDACILREYHSCYLLTISRLSFVDNITPVICWQYHFCHLLIISHLSFVDNITPVICWQHHTCHLLTTSHLSFEGILSTL